MYRSSDFHNVLSLPVVLFGTVGTLLYAHSVLGDSVAWTLSVPAVATLTWLGGAAIFKGTGRATFTDSLTSWGLRGWSWWLLPGLWWTLWTSLPLPEDHPCRILLVETSELWLSVALAGWIATGWTMRRETRFLQETGFLTWLLLAIAVYVVVFTGMNWGLWFNLRLPHGDSAMYEEHLWNLEHGKGFRSYLDQGLFLGEHIQVIHVLLVPLHLIWPSQLLLELCESLALAVGAVPVFLIARRHSRSDRVALLLALAYLLYFPMQYLDIAIDLKTFRPIAFGVPLLLWAIDRMERRRYVSMTILLLFTLSAKEDYAIVMCLLGLWLCISSAVGGWRRERGEVRVENREPQGASRGSTVECETTGASALRLSTLNSPPIIVGGVMAVLAGAYLFAAVKFVIPWFRGGETVHYARYFEQFGDTPGEILINMLNPVLLFDALGNVGTVLFVLRLLVPLALLPLLSPGRFLVGVPLIVLLCLNTIAVDFPAPVHHFHAPLVPILFWSAAAGLGNLARRRAGVASETAGASARRLIKSAEETEPQGASPGSRAESETTAADTQNTAIARSLFAARLACACALTTGVFWSLGPLGRQFWDSDSATCWRNLYVPGERAQNFEQIDELIPPDAHVASTDFVHTRLTHRERSYDYSDYPRAVANYEDRVPHDTEYIVIDVEHPYHDPRKIAALRNNPYNEVRELIREPDRWELLPKTGNGYFLVLKRRDTAGPRQ